MKFGILGKGRALRPGDIVEVRSAAEILATLDGDGALDKLPFMPEMLAHAGRRYCVSRRVDKICDTISASGSRRMYDTVYLEDLRCNGSAHGGCQAGCKLYWKEAWLRRVGGASDSVTAADGDLTALERLTTSGTRTERGGEEVWRCQATDALKASEPLKVYQLSQYWRELTNGNYGWLRFTGLMIRALFIETASRLRLLKPLPYQGPGPRSGRPSSSPGLRPGDLVEVRSPAEIAKTLDANGLNRGLSFDREMVPYCGRRFLVRDRVQRIVDDKTGRMLHIPKDCIILDGVVCEGHRSTGRWFCPREIYAYWREDWLRKVEQ